ncbi:hypothetical protein [Roseobacter sp. OBYS 0001]|uniref:hypothetical protein n=1 Tax=Roseobacter sp. OBYS 0001 TaxID=882651 RepID=UPI001C7E89EA|nr:hypothetical protein [Roseobacter sp. OBYS 0001]
MNDYDLRLALIRVAICHFVFVKTPFFTVVSGCGNSGSGSVIDHSALSCADPDRMHAECLDQLRKYHLIMDGFVHPVLHLGDWSDIPRTLQSVEFFCAGYSK